MSVYPVNIGPAGPVPQTPSSMLAALLAGVSGVDPDYTANLPGTLIEDIAATDVSAALLCDSAFIELLNSVGPNTANPYLLTLIGNLSGIQIGALTNTSVNVVFSGPAGHIIASGRWLLASYSWPLTRGKGMPLSEVAITIVFSSKPRFSSSVIIRPM